MDLEIIREICKKMPAVTEDIKWEHDLVFSVGEKMFCVTGLDASPTTVSFKVTAEEFTEASQRDGFKPAPYLGRYNWILAEDVTSISQSEWEKVIRKSYDLVRSKLSARIQKQIEDL